MAKLIEWRNLPREERHWRIFLGVLIFLDVCAAFNLLLEVTKP